MANALPGRSRPQLEPSERADLWSARGGAAGRRRFCSGRPNTGRAGPRWRSIARRRSPIFSTAISRAPGRSNPRSAACSIRSPTSCWSPRCCSMLVADRTIAGWSLWAAIVILCREILVSGLREYLAELRVPVPVTRGRQMEDGGATGRARLSDRRAGGRGGAARLGDDRHRAAVDRGDPDALHRLGLYEGELRPCRGRVNVDEGCLFRLGARAHRQSRGGDRASRRSRHRRRAHRLVVAARRGIRPCVREGADHPRGDRPHPCQA